ncbi:RusA family crossover junction endodeoxyribonuclease [Kistimonas asteriae]|uniref:RusA family crossover junction endodeoxyribonuclease n=1 Tax=Kistimonas asteriae TaxID=517724 RepID=UPI001BA5D745|nr:RusA family crossover junction endodeoxyribonuclease [Kistimonas asteriae]
MEYDIQSRLQGVPGTVIDCLNGTNSDAALVAVIPGVPVGKSRPRFSRKGRTYTPSKTALAEEYARAIVVSQTGCKRLEGPVAVEMLTVMPIPLSWTKRKRKAALAGDIRPAVAPDFDNLAKLYCDAMNGVWWQDDKQVVDGRCIKCYGPDPFVMMWCWPVH